MSAILTLMIGLAVQSLGTVQAQPLGYVQSNCSNIVKRAFDLISAQCSKAGRGKVCYGNSSLTADLLPGATNITFSAPGDTLDVSQVKRLTLSSMNTTANTWGVAELKIKADLPDTDPSQMVTMIMFGNTQIADASMDANTAVLSQTPGALARQNQYATATARAIDQQMTKIAATTTKLAGLESTATAHALTPTPTGTISAVKATQVAATATNLAALENTATAAPSITPVIPGTLNGPYKGLQAFYFQSTDSASCDQAPHDGLLIQSPQGIKQRVTLNIDGAIISLGSTVYITAQPGKSLTVNTLEGSATITVGGQSQTATPGLAVQVPLDVNLHASGPPAVPQFYLSDIIRALPISSLPTKIKFAPGLPPGITASTWLFKQPAIKPTGTKTCLSAAAVSSTVTVFGNSTTPYLWITNFALTRTSDGSFISVYHGVDKFSPYTNIYSYHFTDATHIAGDITYTRNFADGTNCVWHWQITLTELSASPIAPSATITPMSN